MCRHCKHPDLGEVEAEVRAKLHLTCFGGDVQACRAAIRARVQELRAQRREFCVAGRSTYRIDYELDILRSATISLSERGTYSWVNDHVAPPNVVAMDRGMKISGPGITYTFDRSRPIGQ